MRVPSSVLLLMIPLKIDLHLSCIADEKRSNMFSEKVITAPSLFQNIGKGFIKDNPTSWPSFQSTTVGSVLSIWSPEPQLQFFSPLLFVSADLQHRLFINEGCDWVSKTSKIPLFNARVRILIHHQLHNYKGEA